MYIDNISEFGAHKPSLLVSLIIKITRSLGKNWFSKRLIFFLRRVALNFSGECIDTELFQGQARLYTKGNICEKRALFSPQIFESFERDFISSYAKDGSIFIDIGSNIGLYSLSVGARYKDFTNTKIHSIEPHPNLFKRLHFNTSLNKDFPIKIHNLAIMDKNEEFNLKTNETNLGQTMISDDGQIKVIGKKLNTFLKEKNINKISALKIDVEGNEEKVLIPFLKEENKKLFPKIIIIERNDNLWDGDLIKTLNNFNFRIYKKTKMNYILIND
ncbi:MAG: FkbM family methyltransferase [Alphaproteobacteria bacterium]